MIERGFGVIRKKFVFLLFFWERVLVGFSCEIFGDMSFGCGNFVRVDFSFNIWIGLCMGYERILYLFFWV